MIFTSTASSHFWTEFYSSGETEREGKPFITKLSSNAVGTGSNLYCVHDKANKLSSYFADCAVIYLMVQFYITYLNMESELKCLLLKMCTNIHKNSCLLLRQRFSVCLLLLLIAFLSV